MWFFSLHHWKIQETMLVLKESMPVPRPPQVLHLLYARVYFLCPEAPVEPKHFLIQCSTTWVEGASPLLICSQHYCKGVHRVVKGRASDTGGRPWGATSPSLPS